MSVVHPVRFSFPRTTTPKRVEGGIEENYGFFFRSFAVGESRARCLGEKGGASFQTTAANSEARAKFQSCPAGGEHEKRSMHPDSCGNSRPAPAGYSAHVIYTSSSSSALSRRFGVGTTVVLFPSSLGVLSRTMERFRYFWFVADGYRAGRVLLDVVYIDRANSGSTDTRRSLETVRPPVRLSVSRRRP